MTEKKNPSNFFFFVKYIISNEFGTHDSFSELIEKSAILTIYLNLMT